MAFFNGRVSQPCVLGVGAVKAKKANDILSNYQLLVYLILAVLMVVAPEAIGFHPPPWKKQRVEYLPTISRTRRAVRSIMRKLRGSYVRRSYKMKEVLSFWILEASRCAQQL